MEEIFMRTDLWGVFERLADDIESRLQPALEDHVSSAAEESLKEFFGELQQFGRTDYLATMVADAGRRVSQAWPNDYGDPTFTVVRRPAFRIEVIFWDQAFNPPHDHISCGAFLALHGHRLNRDFLFQERRTYSETLSTGELTVGDFSYMLEGDTHYIQPEMIHDMFWIDLPVTTVAVRCVNHPRPLADSPRSYLAGGLSTVRPRFRENATLNTLRQGLKTLTKMNRREPDLDLLTELARQLPLGDYVYLVTDSAKLGRSALERMVDAIPSARLDAGGADVKERLQASIPDISARHEVARAISGLPVGPSRLALGFLWLGQDARTAREVVSRRGLEPEVLLPESVDRASEMKPFLAEWVDGAAPERFQL